jgi:glycosyltransferase involved in cell wall biosynthesis
VRLVGYVEVDDLPLVYNLAQGFIFPSRYEGFGLPPLEAMACGIPVICSNAASLTEVVGDAALLVAPNDVEALARAIVQLAGDPHLRVDLRERGLKQASKFSWERTARETVKVYEEVVK